MLTELFPNSILILLVALVLIVSGLKKQPGAGTIGTFIAIGLVILLKGDNLTSVGFSPPNKWGSTIFLGLLLGTGIQLISIILIEPLTERLTGSTHDLSNIEIVKESWGAFLQWILVVWLVVAIIEEGIFRGFLMTETRNLIGDQPWALVLNLLFSSIVFGLSHGYQGRAGIWTTGIIGGILGCIFIFSDFNLWLAIFTHGFIDTIGITLIAVDGDKYLQNRIWGSG